MSRIGEAIKQTRTPAMTSARLAERVTLTPQYIRLIECGGAIPAMETVLKIANQFPDVDGTEWLWLLLTDLWGQPVADAMQAWVLSESRMAAERVEAEG